MAGSSRPCAAVADAIFFQNEGFEIAAYEEKVHSKRPHIRQRCWVGFMKGVTPSSQEGLIPQDTDCSGTNNSGYFVSRSSQLS